MDTEPDDDRPGHVKWLLWLAAPLALALVVVWWPGCRSYPPVSSPESLTLIKQFVTATNTKDLGRLAAAETRFEKLSREGKLTPEERTAFASILSLAKAEQWQEAERAAFQFAQDQVGR